MIFLFFILSFLYSSRLTPEEKYQQALKYFQEGEVEKAKDFIFEILKKDPRNKKASSLYNEILKSEAKRNFLASLIYYEEGDIDTAKQKKEEGLKIVPEVLKDVIDEKILEIKKMLTEKKIIQAKSKIESLYFLAPEDRRVIALKKLTEFDFFKELLKEVKQKQKIFFERKMREARKFLSEGKILFALNSVNEALKYNSKSKEARKLQKELRDRLYGRSSEVSEKQKKKIEKKVNKLLVKLKKYYQKKKFEEVFKLSEKILKLEPENEKAKDYYEESSEILASKLLEEAFEHFQRGKEKKAKKLVEKARRINYKIVEKKSDEFIKKAKKIPPEGKQQQKLKTLFLSFSKILTPEKEEEIRSALTGKLNLKPIWDEYHKGDFVKVRELLEELKRKNPENQNIKFIEYLTNAQIALDAGDFKKAREDLIQAVRINPLHEEVWGFFERLEEVIEILGL